MSETNAPVQETKNADGSTTLSMKLSEMSLEQLEQVNHALGRQRDGIREQMLHIRGLIDRKLAGKRADNINAQIARLEAERDGRPAHDESGAVHASAPSAAVEVSANTLKPVQD